MNDDIVPEPAGPALPTQTYAVLIALAGDTLLLPNLAVAEVLGAEPVQPAEAAPTWLRGYLDWNGRRVPVLSFETLNPTAPAEPRRARIVVLHSPGRRLPVAHLAVVAQAYPHLLPFDRMTATPLPLRDSDRDELVLARVRVAGQEALIPDLDSVEAELARLTAA